MQPNILSRLGARRPAGSSAAMVMRALQAAVSGRGVVSRAPKRS